MCVCNTAWQKLRRNLRSGLEFSRPKSGKSPINTKAASWHDLKCVYWFIVNQSINQSINQSVSQSVNRPTDRSIDRSIKMHDFILTFSNRVSRDVQFFIVTATWALRDSRKNDKVIKIYYEDQTCFFVH